MDLKESFGVEFTPLTPVLRVENAEQGWLVRFETRTWFRGRLPKWIARGLGWLCRRYLAQEVSGAVLASPSAQACCPAVVRRRTSSRPECGWGAMLRSMVASQSTAPVRVPIRVCDAALLLSTLVDMTNDQVETPERREAAFLTAVGILSHLPTEIQAVVEPGVLRSIRPPQGRTPAAG